MHLQKNNQNTHHFHESHRHTSLSRPKALLKPFWEMNRSRCISIERVTWSMAPRQAESAAWHVESFQEWSITHFQQKASLDWTFPTKMHTEMQPEMGKKVCWFLPNLYVLGSVSTPEIGDCTGESVLWIPTIGLMTKTTTTSTKQLGVDWPNEKIPCILIFTEYLLINHKNQPFM